MNGIGDDCDDPDLDGRVDHDWATGAVDNCPDSDNWDQLDADWDGIGDECDLNDDEDSVLDDGDHSGAVGDNRCHSGNKTNCDDNCPFTANEDQADLEGDGVGNACDNCRYTSNLDQAAHDADGLGDACDPDDDDDGICDAGGPLSPGTAGAANGCQPGPSGQDNCPQVKNPDQIDFDENGIGIACDVEESQVFESAHNRELMYNAHTTPILDLELPKQGDPGPGPGLSRPWLRIRDQRGPHHPVFRPGGGQHRHGCGP